MVGLSIASEIQDIKLCQFVVQQRGSADEVPGWARSGLFVLAAARQFGLVLVVLLAIASLVTWRGSDAISVCFNAIAILFIMDVDNLVFRHFVSDATQTEMLAVGGPEIADTEGRILVSPSPPTLTVLHSSC